MNNQMRDPTRDMIKSLNKEIAELRKENERQWKQIERLHSQVEERDKRIAELEENEQAAMDKTDEVRCQLSYSNQRIAELDAKLTIEGDHPFPDDFTALDICVERNKALLSRVAELQKEQKAWRKFTDEANRTLDKADQRIAELEAKCNQRRDDLKQARDILDERFKRIAELESRLCTASNTIGMQSHRVAELEALLNDPVRLRDFIETKISLEQALKGGGVTQKRFRCFGESHDS